jgi:hypothetical protein
MLSAPAARMWQDLGMRSFAWLIVVLIAWVGHGCSTCEKYEVVFSSEVDTGCVDECDQHAEAIRDEAAGRDDVPGARKPCGAFDEPSADLDHYALSCQALRDCLDGEDVGEPRF